MRSRAFTLVRRQPIALLALFVALGGTSFAATRPGDGSQDVIHGCIADGSGRLRIVDPGARCGSRETPIAFNREGRRGPQGPAGNPGPAGAAGHDGAAGAAGAAGHDGANGLDALTATADEPAGSNCATGGTKLTAGLDADRDGTLDPAEVDTALTRFICNGTSGASETAAETLTKLETVDGSGSGLDADTLDGQDSSSFVSTGAFNTLFAGQFDTALAARFFPGTRATTANGSGGNGTDWLGQVYLTAATYPPPGTAFAAGQVLPISQNTALFSLLGTNYGGDGKTTFALPDLRDEAPNGTNYVIAIRGLYPSHP
jgi:hypothetical protein